MEKTDAILRRIKLDAEKRFISAKDGLLCLYPSDEYRGVDNQNGILFLTYWYFLLEDHGILHPAEKDLWIRAVEKLRVVPGLFARSPEDRSNSSHDNDKAIAAGSILCDSPNFAEELVTYGLKTGYSYDIENPGKVNYRWWRWGGDVAFFKLATKTMNPSPWELLWLYGALVWGAFLNKRGDTTGHLLDWLLLKAIRKLPPRQILSPIISGS